MRCLGRENEIVTPADDLRLPMSEERLRAWRGVDCVYALAANMGGRGFIDRAGPLLFLDNVLIAIHTLEAAKTVGARVLFLSSACIYPPRDHPLREEEAYPPEPDGYYGWSKLFGELLFSTYARSLTVRMDSVYGVGEKWSGGREKVIPALCRKIAAGKPELIGGGQSRAFLHVTDAVRALRALMESEREGVVNLGGAHEITIDNLASLIWSIAGKGEILLARKIEGPTGHLRRSLDLSRLHSWIDWEPEVPFEVGLAAEYRWIERQVRA